VATLPTHTTLVAATVSTVSVDGIFSRLHLVNQTAATVVYARGDGTNPVSAADKNYPVFPVPHEGACVPTASTDGSTTSIKLISAGTPTVSILQCDCGD
jgi:hypothetical protein